jgi:DNA-binding transcriptional LysR family regulator
MVHILFQMDTDKLRYFTIIAETGSLTKASQILGISHSGLSKAVRTLESETKLKLFRPQGRGLEITQEGKWLYQKAQEILKIAAEISKPQTERHAFIRIGLSGVIAKTCAGALAAEFEEQLMLHEIDIGEIEGKIVGGDLDFGLAFIPSPKPELEYLEIGEVRFNSHVREDLLGKMSPETLPYVVPVSEFPSNPLGYRTRDGWPYDVPRTSFFAVSGFAIALDLLRSGEAAIYMPDFVATLENARSANRSKIISVKAHKAAATKRKLFLVKRQSVEESPEMKRATKIIRRICCS